MTLIKIKNDFIDAQAISLVGPSDNNEHKLCLCVSGACYWWDFADRKTRNAEMCRVIREWKAARKLAEPKLLRARLCRVAQPKTK